jgi:beta-galactosidase
MIYFRWRQAIAGSEQYHSGLLDNAGRKTIGYNEAQGIAAELQRIGPRIEETRLEAAVAILVDYESRWVLRQQPHNKFLTDAVPMHHVSTSPALRVERDDRYEPRQMVGQAHGAWQYAAPYTALWSRNIPTILTAPDADLSAYKVVIAPFLNLLRPNVVENLTRYVEQGGTLLLGPRSGFKDEYDRLFTTPQPGPLAALTGSTVAFFDSLEPDRFDILRWEDVTPARRTQVALWAEVLDAHDADVLAWYTKGWYANRAAITRKQHASGGTVIYIGCMGSNELYENLLRWLLPQLEVRPTLAALAGVEVCVRRAEDGRRIIFVLNHTTQTQSITLAQPIFDLVAEAQHERTLHLRPSQIVIYEEPA